MQRIIVILTPLVPISLQAQEPVHPALELQAGRFQARVAPAPVPASFPQKNARWVVTVQGPDARRLWSAEVPEPGEDAIHLLSPDGRSYARVQARYHEGHPVLRLWRDGQRHHTIDGAELGFERADLLRREEGTYWLRDEPDSPRIEWVETLRGPEALLRLDCLDGSTRMLRLEEATFAESSEFLVERPLSVSPAPDPDRMQAALRPRVHGLDGPRIVRSGEALELDLRAATRSRSYSFLGVEVHEELPGEGGSRNIVLVPWVTEKGTPLWQSGGIAFRVQLELGDLTPGRYRFIVRGDEKEPLPPLRVEVIPAELSASFASGAGLEYLLTRRGVLRRRGAQGDAYLALSEKELAELGRRLRKAVSHSAPAEELPAQDGLLVEDGRGVLRRRSLVDMTTRVREDLELHLASYFAAASVAR